MLYFPPEHFGEPKSTTNIGIQNTEIDPDTSLEKPVFDPIPFDRSYADPSTIDISKYEKYIDKIHPEYGRHYLDKLRAANQSGVEQFGALLNQAIIGEAVGGSLESIGYLLDLKMYNDLIAGTEKEFGNVLTDIGKSIREWSKEATPVYTDPDMKKYAPGKFSWWMANGASIASSLSLLLPAMGAVSVLGSVGKTLGLGKALAVTAKQFGVRPDFLKWAGIGLSQAVISRHMESLMEASGTREEIIEEYMALGMSKEEAEHYGAVAASNAYKYNWAMLLQDIPQYMILGNFLSKATGSFTTRLAKALKMPTAPIAASKTWDLFSVMVSEGFEEGYQYVVGEESKRIARLVADPEYKGTESFGKRLEGYIKEGEFWTNVTMGALGALAMVGGGKVIDNIKKKGAKGELLTEEEQRIQNIYDFGALFSEAAEKLSRAAQIGDQELIEFETARLTSLIARKGAMSSGLEDTRQFIDNILEDAYKPEELQKYNITQEGVEFIKANFGNFSKDIGVYEELLNKYLENNTNIGMNGAAKLAQEEFLLKKIEERKSSIEDRIEKSKEELNFDNISIEGQSILTNYATIRGMENVLRLLYYRVSKAEEYGLTEEEIAKEKKEIRRLEAVFSLLNEEYSELTEAYKESEGKKKDTENGVDVEAYIKDSKDPKNETLDNKEHPLHSFISNTKRAQFTDLEYKSAQEAFQDSQRALSRGVFNTKYSKEELNTKIHEDYGNKYKELMDSLLKSDNISEANKTAIKALLDAEAHPMTILSLSEGTSVDKALTSSVSKELTKEQKEQAVELEKQYKRDLFYALTGESFITSHRTSKEFTSSVVKELLKDLDSVLNKDYKPTVEVDEETGEEIPSSPTEKQKGSKEKTENIENDLKNPTSSTHEDITTNKWYSNPELLSFSMEELFIGDINQIRVSFNDRLGLLSKEIKEDKSVVYKFQEYDENNKPVGEAHIFSEDSIKQKLNKLNIFPLLDSIFDVQIEGHNNIRIGNSRRFKLDVTNPLSSIKEDKEGNPISITLYSVDNKRHTFTNPIIVQELAYAIRSMAEAYYGIYDSFRSNKGHGLIVTEPRSRLDFIVYTNGIRWVVVNTETKQEEKSKIVQESVLGEMFSVFNDIINLNTKEEQDEYKKSIKTVREPSPTETNTFPSVTEIPSLKKTSKGTIRENNESRNNGGLVEDAATKKAAEELASNEATNINTEFVKTPGPEDAVDDKNPMSEFIGYEEPTEEIEVEKLEHRGDVINFSNLALSAPELNDYLELQGNDMSEDKVEFWINTIDEEDPFWVDNPGLLDRVKKKDITVLNEEGVLENIPIGSTYFIKGKTKINGYKLPAVSNMKMVEHPYTEEDRDNADKYWERQLSNLKETRRKILIAIFEDKIPFVRNLSRHAGVPQQIQGDENNISEVLGINPNNIVLGTAYTDGTINWSSPVGIPFKVTTKGGVYFLIRGGDSHVAVKTNDGSTVALKATRTKISRKHAGVLLDAFVHAFVYGNNSTLFTGNIYRETKGGKKIGVPVTQIINTIVYNGPSTKFVEGKEEFLKNKQLYVEGNTLHYGENSTLNLKDVSKKDREDFIKFVSENLTYSIKRSDFSTPSPFEVHIEGLERKHGETGISFIIRNNLITTSLSPKKKRPFKYPRLKFDVGSIETSDRIEKTEEVIKEEEEQLHREAEKVDTIHKEDTPEKITEVKDISSLPENSLLYIVDSGMPFLFGKVEKDDNGLYLNVNNTWATQRGEEGYPQKIYLNDSDNLYKVLSEVLAPFPDNYFYAKAVEVSKPTERVEKEQSVSDKKAEEDILNDLDDENTLFKVREKSEVKQSEAELQREVDEVKKMISGVFDSPNIKIIDKLIHVASHGKDAWGKWSVDAITLYKGATKGTAYHEAFHHVSLLYLTEKERYLIYREAINRYKLRKNLTPREIEEVLAEKFREYVLTSKKAEEEPRNIGAFFRELVEFIITFLTGRTRISDITIDKLFKAIETGKFKQARPIKENVFKFRGEDFLSEKAGFTLRQVDSVTNTMLYQLFKLNNVTYIEDISNIKFAPVLELFKNRRDFYINSLSKLNSLKTLSERGREIKVHLENRIETYQHILENSNFFFEALKGKLETLNIVKRIENTDDGTQFLTQELDDIAMEKQLANFDKSTFEFNSADRVTATIKFMVMTTPSTTEVEPLTGLPLFEDFNVLYSKLMYELWNFDNLSDMMNHLKEKAKTDSFFDYLVNGKTDPKTGAVHRIGLNNAPERIRTQFFRSFEKFRFNFITMLTSTPDNPSYKALESMSNREAGIVLRSWARGFQYSSIFKFDLDTPLTPNKEKAKQVALLYDKTISELTRNFNRSTGTLNNLQNYIEKTVKFLRFIGLNLNEDTLFAYLASIQENNKESINTIDEALIYMLTGVDSRGKGLLLKDIFTYNPNSRYKSLLTSIALGESIQGKQKEITYVDAFKFKSIIKELSLIYAKTNNQTISNIVLGPDNNMYYTYANSSFVTSFVKRINKPNSTLLAELKEDIYNGNSLFISQIEEGANLGIVTYSQFENSKYLDLDNSADFIFKLHMLMTDIDVNTPHYIPFPTLADKPTYHLFSGLKRLDIGRITISNNNYVVSNEVVDAILGYKKDEENRIKKAKEDIEYAIETKDYSKLRVNYHYQELNSKGEPILKEKGKYTGNATRYSHFPVLNRSNLIRGQVKQFLNLRIKDTIELAKRLGVIEVITSPTDPNVYLNIVNRKIDRNLVSKARALYGGSEMNAIAHILTDFTINSIIGNIESEKLLSKDIAFYKNAEDKAKRLASLIAPGESLRVDYDTGEYAGKTTYKTIVLATQSIDSSLADINGELAESFKKQVKKLHPNLSESGVEGIVKSILSSYTNIDSSDGQSWVTPQFHRELKDRMGEWTDQMEEAYNILMDPSIEITLEEDIKLRELIMQPLKYVYYGIINKDNLGIPLYDKMAMATLFPRQVKGTRLEALYDHMVDKNIGMVKFDSVVKVGSTIPSMYFTKDGVNPDALDSSVVEEQGLQDLRMQQYTDPYENNTSILASQVKKVIPEIIPETSKILSSLSDLGKDRLRKELGVDAQGNIDYSKLYSFLRERAKKSNLTNDIIDALKVLEDGTPYLHIDSFFDSKWIESALISSVKKATADVKVTGNAYFQATSFGDRSIVRDNTLKMVDSAGFTEVKVSIELLKDVIPNYENLTFEEARDWVLKNRDVSLDFEGIMYRIPTQGPNMVVPFVIKDVLPTYTKNTIMVPLEFVALTDSDFDIDKLYLYTYNYEKIGKGEVDRVSFITGDEGDLVTKEETFKKLYNAKYGKRVRLLKALKAALEKANRHSEFSNTVRNNLNNEQQVFLTDLVQSKLETILADWNIKNIRPSEVHDIIESLEAEIVSFEEYMIDNTGKDVYELNTKEALENKMLDSYINYLTAEENRLDTKGPLSHYIKEVKKIKKDIFALEGGEKAERFLENVSPLYQHQTKILFSSSKDGIAPFALNIVHHSIGMNADLGLNFYLGTGNVRKEGKGVDLSQKYGQDNISIFNWLSAMISANADALKDPYIFHLNVNPVTWNTTNLLLRAGAGDITFYYLAQPIIKEYVDTINNKQSTKELVKRYINNIAVALRNANKEATEKDINEFVGQFRDPKTIFNKKNLRSNIDEKTARNVNWYAKQLAILYNYIETSHKAGKLSKLIQHSQVDTGGYGYTVSSVKLFDRGLNETLLDPIFINAERTFTDTFLGKYKENTTDFIRDTFGGLTLGSSVGFSSVLEIICTELGVYDMTSKKSKALVDKITKELLALIKGGFFVSETGFGITPERVKALFQSEGAVGAMSFIFKQGKVSDLKEVTDNYLVHYLLSYMDDKSKSWFLESPIIDSKDPFLRERLIEGFMSLLQSNDEKVRNFGQNLFAYAFYTSGFSRTIYSLNHTIPHELLRERFVPGGISFNDYIKLALTKFNDNYYALEQLASLRREFYLNNWDDNRIVPFVEFVHSSFNYPLVSRDEKGKLQSRIFVGSKDSFIGLNYMQQPIGYPFVKKEIDGEIVLYEYVGNVTENKGSRPTILPVYRRVNKKGYVTPERNHKIKEYGLEGKSIIESNNSKLEVKEDASIVIKNYLESKGPAAQQIYHTFESMSGDKSMVTVTDKEAIKEIVEGTEEETTDVTEQTPTTSKETTTVSELTTEKQNLLPISIEGKSSEYVREANAMLSELALDENIDLDTFKEHIEHFKYC